MLKSKKSLMFARVAVAVVFLALWQYLSYARHMEFYVSKPSDIYARLIEWIEDGTLLINTEATLFVAVVGFVIGSLAGLGVGLLLGRTPVIAKVIDPFLMAIYSMPKIALAPVFVLWFGVDTSMKVIFVCVVVFFLVFLNTYSGVINVARDQITILRLMGASERHLMTKVILPSALVWVFTGLRLSVPYALVGAILGEMVATNQGLGFLLANAAGTFDSAGTFATLVVIVILSMTFNALVHVAEGALMPWRASLDAQEVSI
jgi:NitT/TauT family transport system permease protein